MNMKRIKHIALLIVLSFGLTTTSCLEEFDFKTETFESAIVIEATITNEFKNQEISLTRTFQFEEDGPSAESNADVRIVDGSGTIYNFQESATPGKYISTTAFAAVNGTSYRLLVTTSDGRNYESNETQLTNVTSIDSVEAIRTTDGEGNDGMSIIVDSFDPTGNSKYYRYEYEETYKIIAPSWTAFDAIVISDTPPFEVDTTPRTQEERTCYNTVESNNIIITDTNGLSEDRVSDFSVRFISRNNYIITHRYSILVRQYIQSLEAHTFYKTLRDLSGSESLFSQTQPGFFNGNVFSASNSEEKVLGFFEVSSVDEERIFFNFTDFYAGEELPPYITACVPFSPPLSTPAMPPVSPLIQAIEFGDVKYFADNDSPEEGEGPYWMVVRECGDCTALGSNIVPSFWVD